MKKKSEANLILTVGGIKQIMDLFSGPFLITYFGRIAGNATVSLSVYNILMYFFLAVGSALAGPLVAKTFKIGLFRTGIVLNIIYFVIFILFGDAVVDYVWIVGILAGLAGAAYWYPLAIIKASKITEEERAEFFSRDRIVITLVAILGPVLLGSLISGLSYLQTALMVAGITIVQLLLTFFLKPIPAETEKEFHFLKAIGVFCKNPDIRQIWLVHFATGVTISGMALRTVSTLVLTGEGLSELEIGYATSAGSILTIIAVIVFNRMLKRFRDTKRYVLLCGFLPVLSYAAAVFTGSLWLYILFFVLSISLPCIMHTAHQIKLFEAVADGTQASKYRGEYFAVNEFILAFGRILGCGLLIPAALCDNHLVMDLVTWFLVLSMGILSLVTNRYTWRVKQ